MENSFTCKSGCEYEIKVIVKDKNGYQLASEPVSLQIPVDNIPPVWEGTSESVLAIDFTDKEFNHFNVTSIPTSKNTLEYNEKIYYYIDNNKTATLDNFTTKSYTSYLEEDKYCIYFHGDDGDYIHFLVKDTYGNYTIKDINIQRQDYSFPLECTRVDSSNVKLSVPSPYSSYTYNNFYMQKLTKEEYGVTWGDASVITTEISTQKSYNLKASDYPLFIRVSPDCKFEQTNNQVCKILYFNPKAIAAGKTISLKSVIKNGDEYIIIADAPVFDYSA